MKIIYLFILLIPISIFAFTHDVELSRCIDGDTAEFSLEKELITVRFLAIDTPETRHPKKGLEPYGKDASDFTCNSLKRASKIKIEYDKESSKMDKYNRHLAWIWIDKKLLQLELIKNGFAKVDYIYGDYKYLQQLYREENIAKENNIKIWRNHNKIKITIKHVSYNDTFFVNKGDILHKPKVKIKDHFILFWKENNSIYTFNNVVNNDIIIEPYTIRKKSVIYFVNVFIYTLALLIYKQSKLN